MSAGVLPGSISREALSARWCWCWFHDRLSAGVLLELAAGVLAVSISREALSAPSSQTSAGVLPDISREALSVRWFHDGLSAGVLLVFAAGRLPDISRGARWCWCSLSGSAGVLLVFAGVPSVSREALRTCSREAPRHQQGCSLTSAGRLLVLAGAGAGVRCQDQQGGSQAGGPSASFQPKRPAGRAHKPTSVAAVPCLVISTTS